jgi:hypothetical protein
MKYQNEAVENERPSKPYKKIGKYQNWFQPHQWSLILAVGKDMAINKLHLHYCRLFIDH